MSIEKLLLLSEKSPPLTPCVSFIPVTCNKYTVFSNECHYISNIANIAGKNKPNFTSNNTYGSKQLIINNEMSNKLLISEMKNDFSFGNIDNIFYLSNEL